MYTATDKFVPSPSGPIGLITRSGRFSQLVGPGKAYKIIISLKRVVLEDLDFESSLRQALPLKIQVTDQRQYLRTGEHPYLHGKVTSVTHYRDGKVVSFKNLSGSILALPGVNPQRGWEYFTVWIPDSRKGLAGIIA